MSKKERIMVFIDHNNIFHEYYKIKFQFSWAKLKSLVSEKRNLIKITSYIGVDPLLDPIEIMKREKFYYFLKKQGFTVVKIPLKIHRDGTREEKEIDTSIAVDMIANAYENNFDTAVLVGGDRDYRPVIKRLLFLNKNVEIWSYRKALSPILRDAIAPKYVYYIDNYLNKLKR